MFQEISTTDTIEGEDIQVWTPDAAQTLAMARAVSVYDAKMGQGVTITRQVGYGFAEALTNATFNAYFSDCTTATADFAADYFIYQKGTDPVLFSGPVDLAGGVSFSGGFLGPFSVKGDSTNVGFSVSAANLVTIGASGGIQTHVVNGFVSIVHASTDSAAIAVNNTTTQDAIIRYKTNTSGSALTWSTGLDHSGDSFVVSNHATLSTNAYFSINNSGLVTLGASGGTQTNVVNGNLNVTGIVGVGGSALTALSMVEVTANKLSSTNQLCFYTGTYRGTSAATASVRGFYADIGTAAASFTSTSVYCFGGAITALAGSTITRATTYLINANTATGTISNSASIADNVVYTGSWFINSTSTNASQFSGRVGIIGAASTAATLNTSNSSGNSGATQYGIINNFIAANDATTAIYGAYTSGKSPNNAATYALLVGLNVDVEGGAASTVTRRIAIKATQTAGGTVTYSATLADNTSFTSNYFIHSTNTSWSVLGGPLQATGFLASSGAVGPVTGAIYDGGVSGRFNSVPTTNVAFGSIEAYTNCSTNTAITAAATSAVAIGGIYSRFLRTITDDVTDTTTNGFAAITAEMRTNVSSGKTYTFTDSNGWSNISIPTFTIGAGSCAISYYSKIKIESDSLNTGPAKYGLYIGLLSGATANYSIWTSSAQSFFGGFVQVGNQADPGAVTDSIAIGSQDISAGNSTLSLRTETAVATEGSPLTNDRSLTIYINGAKYKIMLVAV